MSPKEWFAQGSPKVVGTAFATALLAGLGAGAWLNLPSYLAEPVYAGAPQMILADDPGRAKWLQVVSTLGGLGATFVVPAYFYDHHTPAPEFAPDVAEQMATVNAEIDEELRQSRERAEAIRVAWEQQAAAPRQYAYAPVRYFEPRADAQPVYSRGYDVAEAEDASDDYGPEQATVEVEDAEPQSSGGW